MSDLFIYKIAEYKVIPGANIGLGPKATKMNQLISRQCPNHVGFDEQNVGSNKSLAQIISKCYCHPSRKAGNFEELVQIQKKHWKANRSFFKAFQFTDHPFGSKS